MQRRQYASAHWLPLCRQGSPLGTTSVIVGRGLQTTLAKSSLLPSSASKLGAQPSSQLQRSGPCGDGACWATQRHARQDTHAHDRGRAASHYGARRVALCRYWHSRRRAASPGVCGAAQCGRSCAICMVVVGNVARWAGCKCCGCRQGVGVVLQPDWPSDRKEVRRLASSTQRSASARV